MLHITKRVTVWNNFITQLFRLLFVDAACCRARAAVILSARRFSASSTLMLLDFPLPKLQSGVFTSYTKLPLPAVLLGIDRISNGETWRLRSSSNLG